MSHALVLIGIVCIGLCIALVCKGLICIGPYQLEPTNKWLGGRLCRQTASKPCAWPVIFGLQCRRQWHRDKFGKSILISPKRAPCFQPSPRFIPTLTEGGIRCPSSQI